MFIRGAADWDAKQEPWRANTFESRLGQATAVNMYPAGASPTGALDMAATLSGVVPEQVRHAQGRGDPFRCPRFR